MELESSVAQPPSESHDVMRGMHCWPGEGGRIALFALVSYIPGTLGAFLDEMRRTLVQGCSAQSHVTVLPPRELSSPDAAASQLALDLRGLAPFEIELGEVKTFDSTSVVYLSLKRGQEVLEKIHAHLIQASVLGFDEKFKYHPHITLAQEFPPERLQEIASFARKRWAEYTGPRQFTVDALTFVRNADGNKWVDLQTYFLNGEDSAAAPG